MPTTSTPRRRNELAATAMTAFAAGAGPPAKTMPTRSSFAMDMKIPCPRAGDSSGLLFGPVDVTVRHTLEEPSLDRGVRRPPLLVARTARGSRERAVSAFAATPGRSIGYGASVHAEHLRSADVGGHGLDLVLALRIGHRIRPGRRPDDGRRRRRQRARRRVRRPLHHARPRM